MFPDFQFARARMTERLRRAERARLAMQVSFPPPSSAEDVTNLVAAATCDMACEVLDIAAGNEVAA